MLAQTSQFAVEEQDVASTESAQETPDNLIGGTDWIVSTLGDLVNYCAFNQLNDVEATLRRAMWEASLQLQQTQQ